MEVNRISFNVVLNVKNLIVTTDNVFAYILQRKTNFQIVVHG